MAKLFSVLVLAQPSADIDDLLEPLLRRPDLGLLRVATTDAARIALRDVAVRLVLVCPETKNAAVTSVLDMTDELRPGTPVLLLRIRGADAPAGWRGRTIAVLRCPVFPDVLDRTVDVALGLSCGPIESPFVKLTVRQAAKLLSVSESEVYRWVDAGEIPCSMMNHQPLFSRAELLEWATARRLPISVKLFEDGEGGPEPVRLADAIERGGVHKGIRGGDRQSVLRAMVEYLPVGDAQDRDLLFEVLLAREALGSTAIGEGIAIPHVRSPLVFAGSRGALALCYLDAPVPFDAPDQQLVHTLFALVSPTIRGHLQLLSRLSLALLDRGFKAAVLRRADRDEIVAEARRVEAALPADPDTKTTTKDE